MTRSKRSKIRSRSALVAVAAALALCSLFPVGASAATVVNGDFETGNLSGWTLINPGEEGEGGWFAYSGTASPLTAGNPEPRVVPAPPQGNFAAISDQQGAGTHILYQDLALEPNANHTLSMLVYYRSYAPIIAPDSLSFEEGANQQYRVDVMRAGSSPTSVSPADVLATVYRTLPGAPESLTPTAVSVDLSPFAGQAVRIRLAEVDNQLYFNAGADAIAISTAPFNAFSFGKLRLKRKNGTAKLEVTVPNAGVLTLADVRSLAKKATASATRKRKRAKVRVKKARLQVAAPGLVTLNVKPTFAGKKTLLAKGKLPFKVKVTFTPNGGTASSQTYKGTLRLKRKKPAR
jgi:hypothetical protein